MGTGGKVVVSLSAGNHDGLTKRGRPHARPFEGLRVSGPTLGMDHASAHATGALAASSTGSGAGMTIMQRAHRERCCSLGGLT